MVDASGRTNSDGWQSLSERSERSGWYFREQGRLLRLGGSSDGVEIFPVLSQRFGTFLRKLVAGIADFAFEGPFDFQIACRFEFLHMPVQVPSCQTESRHKEIKISLFNPGENHHDPQPCRLMDNLVNLH